MSRWGILGILFTLVTVFLPHGASAQLGGITPLTLLPSSQYPGPYDTVTITPQSTVIDLAAATLTLYVDGKQSATQSGGAPFTVSMHGPGSPVSVKRSEERRVGKECRS